MSKETILFLALVFLCDHLNAQTTSDCEGAISVCDGYYEETTAPLSTGSTIEIPFGSCNPTESNSIWYVFTVQQDGLLSFVLDPAVDASDYDWGLYDITSNGCDGISSGQSPEVSCNSWGVLGINGSTGISTANGGTGNSNGPGDLNGPPFNADLPVTAGTTFALAVMNWSASPDGYTLDFGESTASIFDDDPPFLVSVEPNCSGSELTVVFNENILVSTMQLSDFEVTGPGGTYDLSNFIAESGATATQDDTFIFDMSEPLDQAGTYSFVLLEGADFIQDACGNSATESMDFEVGGLMTFETTQSPACNGEGGIIEVLNIQGGVEPYQILLNNVVQPDELFEDLTPGNYTVTIEDDLGCTLSHVVTVENFILWVDAGPDSIPCALNMNLVATFNAGEFLWTVPSDVVVSDDTDPNAQAYTSIEDNYLLTATVTLGECIVSDIVNITFSTPLQPEVISMRASCFGVCDGSVQVISNAGDLNVSVNGVLASGTDILFEGLCAGEYGVFISDFAGCTYETNVTVTEPLQLIADFSADPQPTQVPESTITFTNLSQNDSASYWVFGNPVLGVSFDSSAIFTFPIDVGGVYEVILTITDGFGCADSIMKEVIVADNFLIFAPNAFTPDYDGINDVFLIEFSYAPSEYQLSIFNRWGEPVFLSTDYNQAWTGNVNQGEHFAENGVYNWVLEVKGNEPDKHRLTGHVLVVR